MFKRLVLFSLSLLLICSVFAQSKPQQPAKPMPGKPGTPPPPRMPPPQYVLKKDFEPKIQELENRIRSAAGAGASARGTAEMVADSLNGIAMKVQEIESLLNSANIKLSLNADSIKTTQNRIDELRMELDKAYQALKAEQDKSNMMIYVLFALSILLPVLVWFIANNLYKKLGTEVRNISERVSSDIQKNYISQQDELKKMKTNLDGEVYNAKADLNLHFTREKDATAAQFRKVMDMLEKKADKPEEPA